MEQTFPKLEEGSVTVVDGKSKSDKVTAPPAPADDAITKAIKEAAEKTRDIKDSFEVLDDSKLNIDSLFEYGYLEGTLKLTKSISARYRSISAENSQRIEKEINLNEGYTPRYSMAEITMGHLACSIQAVGNQALPDDPVKKNEALRSMPAFIVNLLISGYQKFSDLCDNVLNEDSLVNF